MSTSKPPFKVKKKPPVVRYPNITEASVKAALFDAFLAWVEDGEIPFRNHMAIQRIVGVRKEDIEGMNDEVIRKHLAKCFPAVEPKKIVIEAMLTPSDIRKIIAEIDTSCLNDAAKKSIIAALEAKAVALEPKP